MRYGVSLPNFGHFSDPHLMVELAGTAEQAGWDGFFVWDHFLVWDGNDVADPWVLLAAIGSATGVIRLGPMVTPLPRRRPWTLARQATTLDHLSHGRLLLGVGIGTPADMEYGAFGEETDPRVRADKLDEGLAIVCGMWSGEPFSFAGSHYRVAEATFRPVPVQRPRIPIWVAGEWPNRRPFRRAARFDGVYPIATDYHPLQPEEVAEIVGYVGDHRQDGDPFDVTVGGPPPGDAGAYAEAGVTWYLIGPPPEGEPAGETMAWIAEGPPS